jgi:TRAP-type mannitol/chloroaromatic compound transport system permease large subunit
VFTVKAAVPDLDVSLADIFRGSIPYWLILIGIVIMIVAVPRIATFLPSL